MPIDNEMRSRIELLVGIDKASYGEVRAKIERLADEKLRLRLDDSELASLADSVKEVISDVGDVGRGLARNFSRLTADHMDRIAETNQQFAKAMKDANTAQQAALRAEARGNKELSEKFKAIAAEKTAQAEVLAKQKIAHQKALEQHLERFKAEQKSIKDLRDAYKPNLKNIREGAENFGEGIASTLNKMQAGDIEGFTSLITGGLAKAASGAGDLLKMGAAATPLAGAATALGAASTALAAAAGALAVAGAAIGVVVAALVMADKQTKELNSSMMEGASIADFAFGSTAANVADVTQTLDNARKAAINLAFEFRGDAKEMAGIIGQLNQAGMSFREMEKAARGHKSQMRAIEEVTKRTFVWSQALGLTTSETAEAMATWSAQFGADLDKIEQQFAAVSKFAQEGGFNVKRFFTSVSQATAGMALYNIRMEEAAYLLSKTSKILGDTDASDFIRSLTQGFTDESMTDRIKRVMIAGGKDTQRIFAATADRTAKGFVDTFQGSKTQDSIESAFKSVGVDFGKDGITFDSANLKKTWASMDAKTRRLVIAELRRNGDEQSAAAARQLEGLGRLTDAAEGGLSEQVKGLQALDMQGKLAFKLQTLGDKRLNDMSAVELAAFEQYAGISGAQLEQLMRVESQLMADFELAKKEGRTTAQSFDEYIATNEEAQAQLNDIKKIEDQATFFARSTVENTRSVLSVLQNTLAATLNNIYSLMTQWYGSDRELSEESINKQQAALKEVQKQREDNMKRLEKLDEDLGKLDETLRTTGEDSEEHKKALDEKQKLEQEKRQRSAAEDYLAAQEGQILMMGESDLSAATDAKDVQGAAAAKLAATGEDVAIVQEHLAKDEAAQLVGQRRDVGVEKLGAHHTMWESGALGKALVTNAGLWEQLTPDWMLPGKGPFEAAAEAQRAQGELVHGALTADLPETIVDASQRLKDEQIASEQAMTEQQTTGLTKAQQEQFTKLKKDMPSLTEKGYLEALHRARAEELVAEAGLTGDKAAQAVEAILSGGKPNLDMSKVTSQSGRIYASMFGYTPGAADGVEGGSAPMAPDFVMRPGQPAQRFNPSDTIVGFKAGGPVEAGMRGGGGTVNITINGGDQSAVYQTVKDALKNSGLRP